MRGQERSGALQTRRREGLIKDPSPEVARARGGGSGGRSQQRRGDGALSRASPVLRRPPKPRTFFSRRGRSEGSASEAKWRRGTAEVG